MTRSLLQLALALSLAAVAVTGCDRLRGDRAQNAAAQAARKAIDAYSKASERSNGAHQAVLQAFKTANAASSLGGYRQAMRDEVLPRMNEFVGRLDAMQAGTPELQKIHKILVEGYRAALTEIGGFVDKLEKPSDLSRFEDIRTRLQERVRLYRDELDRYYKQNQRLLRGGGPAEGAVSTATPVTPTR